MWTTIHQPDARTSHLRTLSKSSRSGLSAFPSSCLTPPHRSARGSRLLYSEFRFRQHRAVISFAVPASRSAPLSRPPRGAGRASYSTFEVRQPPFEIRRFIRAPQSVRTPRRGAHCAHANPLWEGGSLQNFVLTATAAWADVRPHLLTHSRRPSMPAFRLLLACPALSSST